MTDAHSSQCCNLEIPEAFKIHGKVTGKGDSHVKGPIIEFNKYQYFP